VKSKAHSFWWGFIIGAGMNLFTSLALVQVVNKITNPPAT
jgi:hypothetical protein